MVEWFVSNHISLIKFTSEQLLKPQCSTAAFDAASSLSVNRSKLFVKSKKPLILQNGRASKVLIHDFYLFQNAATGAIIHNLKMPRHHGIRFISTNLKPNGLL